MDGYKTNFKGDVNKSTLASTAFENLPNDTFRRNKLESIKPDNIRELVIQVRVSKGEIVTVFPSGNGAKDIRNAFAPKNAEELYINKEGSLNFRYKGIRYELRLLHPMDQD